MNHEPRTANPEQQPTVAFKTLGCRLNQAETAQITASFLSAGYRIVPLGKDADVCVIHSCTITAAAHRKSLQSARSVKTRMPACIVVLAGCAAETDKKAAARQCGADLVVGQDNKFSLPTLIEDRIRRPETRALEAETSPTPVFQTTRALVKVQDGCDFRCSYCLVPDVRGAPVSRPMTEIVEETRALTNSGYKEIILTGANLGTYRDNQATLVDLISELESIEGLARIRLSSIELSTIEREIIACMKDSRHLCHYLHVPLQTGDDHLLSAMRRRYTSAEYANFIKYASDTIPHLGLGTDVIVGLPGETERAFRNTRDMITDLPFSNLHVFPYSPRPGTAAAKMDNSVPSGIKKSRSRELIRIGSNKAIAFARSLVGVPVSMLIERIEDGAGRGWTGEYVEAEITGPTVSLNTVHKFTPGDCRGAILTA